MPINYFWWCSHWASSFLGYISPESKKKPHAFFPATNHASKRREKCFVIWVLQVAKARHQKKIQYIFGEKQPKLERNKFRTWISAFSPSCFVWRCATFGTPQKAAGENFLFKSLQPKCRSTSPWSEFFGGFLGFGLKKSADSTWQTSPPFHAIKLRTLKAERLFVCFSSWYHPRIH